MSRSSKRWALIGLLCTTGCGGSTAVINQAAYSSPPKESAVAQVSDAPLASDHVTPTESVNPDEFLAYVAGDDEASVDSPVVAVLPSATITGITPLFRPATIHDPSPRPLLAKPAAFKIDSSPDANAAENRAATVEAPVAETEIVTDATGVTNAPSGWSMPEISNPVPLNLPSVLASIDGRHPIVGRARWQVQQAYAQLLRAKALWLPSIQAGFSFHRHDGNYQASNGDIVDVNRNSFQYGLGTGATGAGTTALRPGIITQFHLADAIFLPKVAEKAAWAQGHAADATLNQQLLDGAAAYFELLDAHQDLQIVHESRARFAELTTITVDFAEAGQGLNADADRLRTELALMDSRLLAAQERVAVEAVQLAQVISLNGTGTIVPTDVNAIPLELTSPEIDKSSLVATGLRSRPELKEAEALVAAACEAYRREKCAPFVPSVLLGFSTGGFGGGLGNNLDNIDGRYDFDALLSWEVRNLGLGEKAARREQSARVQQSRFEKLRVMDQVAREVSEAHAQVSFRQRQIQITQDAISHAEDSYRRNLERIRDGQGLPLEVLQSVEALESAQRAYLRAVIDYNQAQIRLQWALGFPVAG